MHMTQHLKASYSGQQLAPHLYLKNEGCSFEDSIYTFWTEKRLFQRRIREAIYVKLNDQTGALAYVTTYLRKSQLL